MTQSIYDLFKTESDLEINGFIYKLTPTISVTLARAGGANSRFTQAIDVKTRPIRKQIKGDKTAPDVLELLQGIMKEAFAETVVLNWEGMTHPETNEHLPWSKENALMLLKELPDLFSELQEQAMALANFQAEALADDVKN